MVRPSAPPQVPSANFKMAADVEQTLTKLGTLKTELILDCCSYRLWQEFKNGSKMSPELLSILRDLFIQSKIDDYSEELQKKLHCTRFICGLSEAKKKDNDGVVTVSPLNPVCLAHADDICSLYPFSSFEQKHFKSMVKRQVILTTFQNGKVAKSKELFDKLYDETDDDEEYQEDVRELLSSENVEIQKKILKKFSYEKFLRDVVKFFEPLQNKYDLPFLEKFEENEKLKSIDEESVRCSVLKECYKYIFSDVDDVESSWESIVNGQHPEVKEFNKKSPTQATKSKPSKHYKRIVPLPLGDKSSSEKSDNEEGGKTSQVISNLKESTKDLTDYVEARKAKSCRSPFKKNRWNQKQDSAVAIEWDISSDDDDDDANQPIVRLPSPKGCLNISLPKPSKRRKKNPWSEEELTWLCKGVETYGEGNWSTILRMYGFAPSRTGVDLKDKWRNYCKKF